ELEQLGKLVDALHELQMTDKGALAYRKHRIELGRLIRESHARFAERLSAAGIDVELDLADDIVISGDADQLGRLFGNLFENSLRYTADEGRLRISLAREGTRIVIDFMDSSPGVTDEELPRLFERMFRAEASRNRASGGHGLGLAICQNIVAAHRGEIEARHSPLGGLWLRISVPEDIAEQES